MLATPERTERRVGIIGAMRLAIQNEMNLDPRVFVMGVDAEFGVWGYTRGLRELFGEDRVRNTPISEYAVTGTAIGAAMTGMRPIVDLDVGNFMYTAWDQLANQAAKLPYMTNGALRIPAVFIAASGSARSNAAQHSDVLTAALANTGGLAIAYPTTPEDAAGLMTAAIRSEVPVIFLYPASLGSQRGEQFVVGDPIDFGVARTRRVGTDVTCWASGLMVRRALEAAAILEDEGVSVEVIDPRTLNPLDDEAVLVSVEKTGRLVAADEAREACSLASEIVSRVACKSFSSLRAAPAVVAAPTNVPVPYSPVLEAEVIPSVSRIADACRSVVVDGHKKGQA